MKRNITTNIGYLCDCVPYTYYTCDSICDACGTIHTIADIKDPLFMHLRDSYFCKPDENEKDFCLECLFYCSDYDILPGEKLIDVMMDKKKS